MFEVATRFPAYTPAIYVATDPSRIEIPNRFNLWLAAKYGQVACRFDLTKRQLLPLVDKVQARRQALESLDNQSLLDMVPSCTRLVRRQSTDAAALAEALALACEVSRRELGLSPHGCQVLGALVMLSGGVAEMATGEGKTLTAGLAAVCGALRGQPVHVVTVNDYLARRDGEHLASLYAFFGLTVGIVQSGQDAAERRAAYSRHVTYCTNKDLVFDYMRTQIAAGLQMSPRRAWLDGVLSSSAVTSAALVPRLGFAIVDEVDSILVDEARTPLIISRERDTNLGAICAEALELARQLEPGEHFLFDGQLRSVELTESGRAHLRDLSAGMPGVWRAERQREHLCLQALSAQRVFRRDRDYIVRDGKVQIVDEFTGRVLADRSWERGLHQMVEAKEGCEITPHRDSIARLTYQRFFVRYETLAGMTGTASETAGELWAVYGLKVTRVPTNRPVQRTFLRGRFFRDADERWNAIADRCAEMSAQGRAVLVGTRSVHQSEVLASCLEQRGIAHRVLNAKQDAGEAGIVSRAGRAGHVTVATNMAGRGTDIKLDEGVAARGGLHVILTEFHESQRIDRQLFGRCARQGDPGSAETMVCLDDDLFVRFAPRLRRFVLRWGGPGKEYARGWMEALRLVAQNRAERANARQRMETVRQDASLQRMMAFTGRSE